MLTSVGLFAGAGGLGMSAALAGLTLLAVVERDRWACETISRNKELDFPLVSQWPVTDADVRDFAFESWRGKVDLITRGPPC